MTSDITDKFKDIDMTTALPDSADTPLGLTQLYKTPSVNSDLTKMQLEELLSQKKFYGVFNVTTSTAQNSNVFSVSADYKFANTYHFGTLLSTASAYATWFDSYSYDKILITVELTTMLQQQGALVFVHYNYPSSLFSALSGFNTPQNYCKFPKALMSFGTSKVQTFEISWNSNLAYWPNSALYPENTVTVPITNPFMDNGRLVCYVFDPLRVASGVTDFVQVRVWTQIIGLKLGAYNPKNGFL